MMWLQIPPTTQYPNFVVNYLGEYKIEKLAIELQIDTELMQIREDRFVFS